LSYSSTSSSTSRASTTSLFMSLSSSITTAVIRSITSTFNTDFVEQATIDYSNTTKGLGKGTLVYTRRLKRAGLLVNKETSYKKLLPIYLACEK
jgi:hypothetical protein